MPQESGGATARQHAYARDHGLAHLMRNGQARTKLPPAARLCARQTWGARQSRLCATQLQHSLAETGTLLEGSHWDSTFGRLQGSRAVAAQWVRLSLLWGAWGPCSEVSSNLGCSATRSLCSSGHRIAPRHGGKAGMDGADHGPVSIRDAMAMRMRRSAWRRRRRPPKAWSARWRQPPLTTRCRVAHQTRPSPNRRRRQLQGVSGAAFRCAKHCQHGFRCRPTCQPRDDDGGGLLG